MKCQYLTLPFLCLVAFSCDKAKNIANQARSAVESEIAKQSGKPDQSGDSKPHPELQKLVDQTPDGVIFRKDLPFPGKLEVTTTRIQEISGRIAQSSAIGDQKGALKGTRTTVTRFERDGDHVRYSLVESTFAEPEVENADEAKKPADQPLVPSPITFMFHKTGSVWKADNSGGFRAVALSQQLSPVFGDLLVWNALAPRSLWFGKKRFKIGDQLPVADKSMPMIIGGNATGALMLTLKSFETVKGHPCGVFEISGNYARKQSSDFEGSLTDENVAIRSGKIWLSLIYPLILREEMDTIQTMRSGGQGNAETHGQGSVKVSVIREWKQL